MSHQGDDGKFLDDTSETPKFDSCFVNELYLFDNNSINSKFGDLSDFVNVPGDKQPFTFVYSPVSNVYLKMIMWYGGGRNSFSAFEYGFISKTPKMPDNVYTYDTVLNLITNTGNYLGMSKDSFKMNIKHCQVIERGDSVLEVEVNMPLYYSRYEFNDTNELTSIEFGYVYP